MTSGSLSLVDLTGRPLASQIVNICFEVVRKGLGQLTKEAEQHLFESSRAYADKFMHRNGWVRISELDQAVPLENVYTRIDLIPRVKPKMLDTVELLEEMYQLAPEVDYGAKKSLRKNGIKIAHETQHLCVLGDPGSGKTTFLKILGLRSITTFESSYIPVMVELKRLSTDDFDLKKAISKELEICGFPYPKEFTERLLKQGKLLVLLDGLDEVAKDSRGELIEYIRDFVTHYKQNRIVLSCRKVAYIYDLPQFTNFEIADFNDSQIEEFIYKWFDSREDVEANVARQCWEDLNNPENRLALGLAKTPLLLAFLCLVYDSSLSLPANLGTLCKAALLIMLQKWSAVKRVKRDPIYQGFYPELERQMLSSIAFQGLQEGQKLFPKQQLVTQIRAFLEEILNAPKNLNGEAVLLAIEEQQGILTEQAHELFAFSHLTFQEYLAAEYIAPDPERIELLIASRLVDPDWQEVIVLVAELTEHADKLLLTIETKAREYIVGSLRLRSLIDIANELTAGDKSNLNPILRRIFALLFILTLTHEHKLTRAINLTRHLLFSCHETTLSLRTAQEKTKLLTQSFEQSLPALTYELALMLEGAGIFHGIDLEHIKDQVADLKLKTLLSGSKETSTELWNLWLEKFQLNQNDFQLSEEEVGLFENYISSHLTLLRCRKVSLNLSKAMWNLIEERLLLV